MKKIGLICLLLITVSAHAENCANNHGVVVVANNGVKYCQSKTGMNWWSAFA